MMIIHEMEYYRETEKKWMRLAYINIDESQ